MGMLPIVFAMRAEVRANHPTAYVEDDAELDGFRNDRLAILDSLATCTPVAAAPAQADGDRTAGERAGSADDDERLLLEARCVENVADDAALETCLMVVRSYLAPSSGSSPIDATAGADDVTVTSKGGSSTEAFQLAGGDYLIEFTAQSPKQARSGCLMSWSLRDATDNAEVRDLRIDVPRRKSATVETHAYALDPGRYYMSVDIGSCGPWSARVQSVTVDYSEPTPGGIIRDGAGSSPQRRSCLPAATMSSPITEHDVR